MIDPFTLTDALGPEKVIHLADDSIGLRAIVVVDNTAAGQAIGGTRMAVDVTLEECARLARAMSLKNAMAGLPHGGAKSVIRADPSMPPSAKERLIRAFACAISDIRDYAPGPDMGTDETSMAWVRDEIGRAVGLPRVLGGIPLDEIGATGFGVAEAVEAAAPFGGVAVEGARVAIQGLGAVGLHSARNLVLRGARIVCVADSRGSVFAAEGLPIETLAEIKAAGGSVTEWREGTAGHPDDVIAADCDILIPAARPDVIHAGNVNQINARVIAQGANIPATEEAEAALHARGVLVLPDFVTNAGGVICAAVEYRGGSEADAWAAIAERIRRNTAEVLDVARNTGRTPRDAANELAKGRLQQAIDLRRRF